MVAMPSALQSLMQKYEAQSSLNKALIVGTGLLALFGIGWAIRRKYMEDDDIGTIDLGTSSTSGSSGSAPAASAIYNLPQYKPLASETNDLLLAAAKYAGLPVDWATSIDMHNLLASESQGWVGIPNYQFGAFWGGKKHEEWPIIWAAIKTGKWRDMLIEPYKSGPQGKQSSATGLGQLTLTNIASGNYYPSGVNGIGVALEEAIGMLRYIASHNFDISSRSVKPGTGTPQSAWAFHQAVGWY